jgi:ribosomal protein S27AE
MRPNTGVEGSKLVIPDVDECPLCGEMWTSNDTNESQRWDRERARPAAIQVRQADGGPLSAALVWTCGRCGYQHVHQDGQRGSDA